MPAVFLICVVKRRKYWVRRNDSVFGIGKAGQEVFADVQRVAVEGENGLAGVAVACTVVAPAQAEAGWLLCVEPQADGAVAAVLQRGSGVAEGRARDAGLRVYPGDAVAVQPYFAQPVVIIRPAFVSDRYVETGTVLLQFAGERTLVQQPVAHGRRRQDAGVMPVGMLQDAAAFDGGRVSSM